MNLLINTAIKRLRQLSWIFDAEQILYEGQGLYSKVKVVKRGNWITLYTGNNYLQTTVNTTIAPRGNIFDWYLVAPWFSGNFNGKLNSLLILGLCGGSQVKSYNKFYKVASITGVEIDPLIVDLGKKFFNLSDANLNTVIENASLFLDTTNEKYSVIILDIFKENIFESKCASEEFINKIASHLEYEGVVLINRVLGDKSSLQMVNEFKKKFNLVIALTLYKSVFYIATNSKSAPKDLLEVKRIFANAVELNPDLKFFTKLKPKCISF